MFILYINNIFRSYFLDFLNNFSDNYVIKLVINYFVIHFNRRINDGNFIRVNALHIKYWVRNLWHSKALSLWWSGSDTSTFWTWYSLFWRPNCRSDIEARASFDKSFCRCTDISRMCAECSYTLLSEVDETHAKNVDRSSC